MDNHTLDKPSIEQILEQRRAHRSKTPHSPMHTNTISEDAVTASPAPPAEHCTPSYADTVRATETISHSLRFDMSDGRKYSLSRSAIISVIYEHDTQAREERLIMTTSMGIIMVRGQRFDRLFEQYDLGFVRHFHVGRMVNGEAVVENIMLMREE